MFTAETELIVRYAETDQMGIAHHSNYPIWFEAGRTDFIRKMGLPYSEIEKNGFLLPLIELQCCYKGFARYEDRVIIRTSVKDKSNTRLSFYYEAYKNDGRELITTGATMHVWTNTSLKPVNISRKAPWIYELLCKASDNV